MQRKIRGKSEEIICWAKTFKALFRAVAMKEKDFAILKIRPTLGLLLHKMSPVFHFFLLWVHSYVQKDWKEKEK